MHLGDTLLQLISTEQGLPPAPGMSLFEEINDPIVVVEREGL
jgi:hypothetical protein